MKSKLFLFAFSLLAFIGSEAQNYVTLYSDCDYRGQSQAFKVGRYYLNQSRIGVSNLSSIRIPSGMKAVIYTGNEPGTGSKSSLTSDISCLTSVGFNDQAATMVVEFSGGYNNNGNNGGGWNNNGNNGGGWNNNSYGGVVTIYADCNYRGGSQSLSLGYHNANSLGIGNDVLSSMRIPSGYTVTVYRDDNYRGESRIFYNDINCISSDFNDQVSSIYISRGYNNNGGSWNNNNGGGWNNNNNNNSGGGVTLYADCNFRGSSNTLRTGYYGPNSLGIGNDALSSLRVPSGYSITIYENGSFNGSQTTYSSDMYCLPTWWNDKVSSVYIRYTGF
jgi:hypothetical protein